MVDSTVIDLIRLFLKKLHTIGIQARRGVLYGSFARGEAHEWSDIDLIVIAPEFDREYDHTLLEDMWGARAGVDLRLEPLPCGEREWEEDEGRPILEIARQEGIPISL